MPDVFDTVTLDAPDKPAGDIFDSIPVGEADSIPGPTVGDVFDKLNLVGVPRGGFGEFVKGLDLKSIPKDILGSLSPATGGIQDIARGYRFVADVLSGRPITDAAAEHFPESTALKDIEKKPIRERVATGINTALQMLFAKQMAEGVPLSRNAQTVEAAPAAEATSAAPSDAAQTPGALGETALPAQPDVFDTVAAAEAPAIDVASKVTAADNAAPAEASPSVALDKVVQQFPVEDTQTVPETAGSVHEIPSKQIASRPELMQFKRVDDAATGTNEADKITAPYDPYKAQTLLLWEPNNPKEYGLTDEQKYIVANGHHRNATAQEQGVAIQNAQILRESAGVSAGDARAIAAEANIADGKGTIYDQAKFIRNESATHGPDAAMERARQIGARGQKAATIALQAAPDLYASFINEQITPDAAASIADAAPGNEGLQRLGISAAAKGEKPPDIYNFLQAAQVMTPIETAQQGDMFGSNDAALNAAMEAGKRAGAIQKEIGDQIASVQGAAKRPDKAKALGVNVDDPAAVNTKLDQLKQLRERARMWRNDPQIRDMAMRGSMAPADAVAQLGGVETAKPVSTEPMPEDEILRPANKMPDGKIFEANSHGQAMTAADRAGYPREVVNKSVPGYTTKLGRFLNKDEAYHQALFNKQIDLRTYDPEGDRAQTLESFRFHQTARDLPKPKRTAGDIFEETQRQIDERYNAALKAAGDADAIEMRGTGKDEHLTRVLITREPGQPGKWRATRFQDIRGEGEQPIGHNVFDSKADAIADYTGKRIKGPPYGFNYEVTKAVKASPEPVEGETASNAKAPEINKGVEKPGMETSWRRNFANAVKDTERFPRPWKLVTEQDGRKTVIYALDATGKFVSELPRQVGQTLDQLREEAEGLVAEANKATAEKLELSAPESDAEMGTRQQLEAQNNAEIAREAEKKAQVQYGWKQKLAGDAGDLGQRELGGDVGGPDDLFGFGPGAAAVGEIPLRAESELHQLHDVVNAALKDEPKTASASQQVATAVKAARKAPGNPQGNAAKAAVTALWRAYRSPLTPGLRGLLGGARTQGRDFMNALKDWQGADQRTSFYVRQWAQDLRRQIPDALTREAITNYIQADGDVSLLQQRAAASKKFSAGYEAATRLTPAQQTVAENVRQYFDAMHRIGVRAGILNGAVENYITQMWKRPNRFTNALTAELQSGKLQKDFKYARKRIFDSFFEGEQADYAPATKDFSALVAAYDLAFNKSLSARALINALRKGKAADGEPVTRFSGMVMRIPGQDVPPEAYLIRSRALPKEAVAADGRAYQVISHPALQGWKFVAQDAPEGSDATPIPAYYQADMLVHPDHYEHLNNVLKTSQWRKGALGAIMGPLFKAGALMKQTRLSLAAFHLDQEGLHGLFHRVNPANLDHIDFNDPTQYRLIRNGLLVSDYSAMELFAEGLRGGGLVSKIPGLGPLQNNFNEFLFKDYIPRLKMTMALHAYDRNVARYPNLPADAIAEMTARQGNAAFGELNHKLLGRSPTVQDTLRLLLLAPDFLEARAKFVGQALKPYGQEQRSALLLGAAVMYAGARALNQWLDNNPHWDKPFAVIYNGREYHLRTVMGDAVEAFTDPQRFFYNRFSPWLKTIFTVGTQRDYRGIKLTRWEQLKDTLSWFVPIPVGQGNEANTVKQWVQQTPQRTLASFGVSSKQAETPIDQVYKSALRWKETLTDPKIQQEVKRAQQETYAQGDYARLNRSLLNTDKEQAVTEIVSLMKDKGKTPIDLAKYYDGLPSSPFTGSVQLDYRWHRVMTPPEQSQYNKAIQQRLAMARLFFQLYPMAQAEYRKEK
jgi:hypothetical protein